MKMEASLLAIVFRKSLNLTFQIRKAFLRRCVFSYFVQQVVVWVRQILFFVLCASNVLLKILGEQARAQLGEQAASLTPRAFESAVRDGSVETFALVRPAAANQFCGVYVYLDEIGVMKELPPNPRGNALAMACGKRISHFKVFLSNGNPIVTNLSPICIILLHILWGQVTWV
jgi:hypothetical protein